MRTERLRWGIRARLLLLLLPGIALALTFDSWADHRARFAAVNDALDEVLLQPLAVLDASVQPEGRNGLALQPALELRTMFDALPARHKFLFAGERPTGDGAAPEQVLLGSGPLPAPPPGQAPATGFPNLLTTPDARVYLYEAQHLGMPVRIALLERTALDAEGRPHRVRLQVAESTARREQIRRESLERELRQGVRTLLVAAALLVLGVSWSLLPLARLRDRVRAQPPGEPQPLPAAEVPPEVAPLVDAVNLSIERYRAVLGEQERFLADAAHQLRTPVAVMMTQVGYAQRAQDPAAATEALEAIARQLQRSRRIADQLLAMSHAVTAGTPQQAPPVTDLEAAAREAVLDALPMAQSLGVDLGIAADDGAAAPALPVRAGAEEIREALGNLLHNALRHTPRGGSVSVAIGLDGASGFVDVVDAGPGIAPARREAVFERFHSRPQGAQAGGAGLGLAIARAYARKRGGDVTLHDAPAGPGLRARLRLPRA